MNVLVAFWFNNLVLDGDFVWLGWNWAIAPNGVLSYDFKATAPASYSFNGTKMNKEELLYRTFPRRAECQVHTGGSGSGLQKTNYYCILGPNSLSQYLFVFLWFWYAILLIINVLNLLRIIFMIFRVGAFRNVYLMSAVGSYKVLIHMMFCFKKYSYVLLRFDTNLR